MSDYFQNQQTPSHEGGTIPNLTCYDEKTVDHSGFASAEQVYAAMKMKGMQDSGGMAADVTGLRAG